jgi:hypothetical protein
MKYLKLLILLISSSFILCACPGREDGSYTIIIKNNSNRAIAWQPRIFNVSEKEEQYDCKYVVGGSIQSHSSQEFDKVRDSWDRELGSSRYLQLMIIDRDSALKYPVSECDTFRKYVPVLKTYRLTLEDLKQRNWTVEFP